MDMRKALEQAMKLDMPENATPVKLELDAYGVWSLTIYLKSTDRNTDLFQVVFLNR